MTDNIYSVWFVMIDQGNGSIAPLVDDTDNVALFKTELEASEAGCKNQLGNAFGYDIYEWSV